MQAFRDGEVRALIATDIASRGIDITHITHVVNVGVPREPERYLHRIGRTGRAGRSGVAITLVPPGDRRRWQHVCRFTGDTVRTLSFERGELAGLFERATRRQPAANGKPTAKGKPSTDRRPATGRRPRKRRGR
jgi:superfamily II DNA/RNA helicase